MDIQCVFAYLFCILLTGSTKATALVVSHPRDVTVANGTWASFECRISCTNVFYWFVGSGRYRRLTNVDVNRFVQRNGIQAEVSRSSECTDNGDYTQQLRVLATPEVNRTAVQCAAVSRPPTPNGVFFSSYAVLMVEPIEPTEMTINSEVSPEPVPSPSLPEPNSNCNDRPSNFAVSRAQTLVEVTVPATGITTNSGQLRLSGVPSLVILLTVLLVIALSQL